MIWIGTAIGFVCFSLGMFVMALCNAASERRTVNLYVARWTRIRKALRELMAAEQSGRRRWPEPVEMAEAMSKAAEVLDESCRPPRL